jgi:tetratricopeptide (TPR) repeat protein
MQHAIQHKRQDIRQGRCTLLLICVAMLLTCAGTSTVIARVGPLVMETARGKARVHLLKRDDKLVWILRETAAGQSVETGVNISDIITFQMPPSRVLAAAGRELSDDDARKVLPPLTRLAGQLEPFGDLPGIPAAEALFKRARLLEQLERWDEALEAYDALIEYGWDSEYTSSAELRAGLCLIALERAEEAVERLADVEVPSDDPDLLCDLHFGRGSAYEALEQYDAAILDYLYPVVFYPFRANNEARGLLAALGCYVELKDWDATAKTYRALAKQHGDSEEFSEAEALVEPYREEIESEARFTLEYEMDAETE